MDNGYLTHMNSKMESEIQCSFLITNNEIIKFDTLLLNLRQWLSIVCNLMLFWAIIIICCKNYIICDWNWCGISYELQKIASYLCILKRQVYQTFCRWFHFKLKHWNLFINIISFFFFYPQTACEWLVTLKIWNSIWWGKHRNSYLLMIS